MLIAVSILVLLLISLPASINMSPLLFIVAIAALALLWRYRKSLVLGFLALIGYRSLHRKLDRVGHQPTSRRDDV
jgi:hypothetical protein